MFTIYRWLYRQFAFSRGQSNGLLVLIPLCLLFVFSEPIWRFVRFRTPADYTQESEYLDSVMIALFKVPDPDYERFEFDPNRCSTEDLQRLGFSPAVARRINAFAEKGGGFNKPEDLYRIYGIDSAFVQEIEAWIRIANPRRTANTLASADDNRRKARIQRLEPFDLNLADTTQFKLVRGIGSKLSQRIVKYREALGGFYAQNQLYEVFKLDSGVVRELHEVSFVAQDFTPRQISINSAQPSDLASHPYLTPREASAIVAYRFTHGKFAAVQDLGKIGGLDSIRLARMLPYLTVD